MAEYTIIPPYRNVPRPDSPPRYEESPRYKLPTQYKIGTATPWAPTTAYVAGDHVELSTGEILRVVTPGTSGASEPAAPGYNQTVADGGVTWRQVTA